MEACNITGSRKERIDRSSPIPAYQQIANDITQRIGQNEWNIDEKLPAEYDLAAEYGVSRVTLRQAMAQLEKDGIIEKFQGKGAFVKNNPRQLIQNLIFPSLDTVAPYPNPVQSAVVSITRTTAPNPFVRNGLNVSTSEPLTYVQRIFYHDGRPSGINHIWFRCSDVPELSVGSLLDGSISKTLKYRYHYDITAIENYMEAVRLDALTASMLNTAYDASGLKIDSQYLLADGTPIEYSSTIWLGDSTRFHYRVQK